MCTFRVLFAAVFRFKIIRSPPGSPCIYFLSGLGKMLGKHTSQACSRKSLSQSANRVRLLPKYTSNTVTKAFLEKLKSMFTPPAPKPNPVKVARDELMEQVLSPTPDYAAISLLVDNLSSTGLPFREELIGGGPWQVIGCDAKPVVLEPATRLQHVSSSHSAADNVSDRRVSPATRHFSSAGPS